jgi:hypothetical protein
MRSSNLSKLTGVLMLAMIPVFTTVIAGDKPTPAQTGIIVPTGSQTSGGTVGYGFALTANEAGSLTVKASIKLGKWKVNFPDLNSTPAVGVSAINGPVINVPADVQGTASMKVNVKFNKKNITKRTIQVVIGAPAPVPGSVSTNILDAGFENAVTLDSSIVPTTGMGATLTYTWTQTSGKTVALSASNVAKPNFTTDAITNFVNMGPSLYVNDIDDSGYTNALYVTPECRFGPIGGVPLDAEQSGAATYGFRVLVSDGSITRTGLFTVACSIQTPAQPNVPVGVYANYKAATNSTSWSFVSAPAGSTAALIHTNGLIPELRPDVEGVYIIRDNVTGQTITNTAATWTGYQFCAICHGPGNNVNQTDIVTPWSQTAHASFFQRAIDGEESPYYNKSCITCHTVGNNTAPTAVNNGFDDVAKQLGWTFPSVLKPGNFAAMPTQLQNLSNIQCESCHGPGSLHPGAPSVSLDVKVCASCHQDGHYHVRPQQWEISPHAGAYENTSKAEGIRTPCSRCHSPNGFIETAKRLDAGKSFPAANSNTVFGIGPLTCQACHDPHDNHDNPDRHQLRVYDEATVGDWNLTNNIVVDAATAQSELFNNPSVQYATVTVTNLGTSATCVECHNARRLGMNQNGTNGLYGVTSTPHDSTAAEAFLGIGAMDYGVQMGNSFHTYLARCTTCHMYQGNTAGNTVGDHTFSMAHVDGNDEYQNVAACNQCHTEPVTDFDFIAVNGQDYDGNGIIEGVQTETQGLLDSLGFLMKTTGVSITTNAEGHVTNISSSSGYSTNAVIKAAQRKVLWNWLTEYREGSFGVHNTQWTVRLLQTSYTDLSTNWYGDSSATFRNAFPNAYLR